MKKQGIVLGVGSVMLVLSGCSGDSGSVEIKLPADYKADKIVVSHLTLSNIFEAKKQEDLKITYDTLDVKDGIAHLKLDDRGASCYNIEPEEMTFMQPDFYAVPGENLKVDIKSFEPLEYTVTGSELMEDITAAMSITKPIQIEYHNLMKDNDSVSPAVAKEIIDRYDAAIKKFVADHPKSPAVPYLILDLSGKDFKTIYDNMTPEARKSILMPYAEEYNRQVEEMLAEEKAEAEEKEVIASGKRVAPDFTLPDLTGKMVSLSDFKGKWVVLDFWGSWCGWCIKGFPALKEAYAQYGDKIQIIGIGCNEPEADWREGVKKYELPWLNLYNGDSKSLYEAYNITGFPTKAIVNPEGKLVDLTTGEDPSFFTRLASFVK